MNREKGIGRCGLACCLCGGNDGNCPGCRKEGCPDMEWCLQYNCSKANNLDGCWDCASESCAGFSCENTAKDKTALSCIPESCKDKRDMFNGKLKTRAFTAFVKQYGEEKLMDCLERNEKAGVIYHEPGTIIGDYDKCADVKGVFSLLLNGKGEA